MPDLTTQLGGGGGSGYVIQATGAHRLAKLPSGELVLQREYIRLNDGTTEWQTEPTVEIDHD